MRSIGARRSSVRSLCLRVSVASVDLLLAVALISSAACGRSPERPPNVILISVDTLRADYLNVYGYEAHPVSPNIDALAGDGVVHLNHITASPWTTPAHASLLTSLRPSSHGVIDSFETVWQGIVQQASFNRLASERLTLAEALGDAGYATAAFTGGVTVDASIGFDQGFDRYEHNMYKLSDASISEMLEWVGSREDEPFFLFWHTFEVHAPYLHGDFLVGEPRLLEAYAGLSDALQETRSAEDHEGGLPTTRRSRVMAWDLSSAVEFVETLLRRFGAFNPETCSQLYAGGVLSFDRWLGRVIDSLKDRGLYENTLIVLTSDHGEEFAEHDPRYFYNKHGHSTFEEMVRVPLIVKLPGGRLAGTQIESVTRAIDVMPTVLELVGAVPDGHSMQGESLAPSWRGAGGGERVALVEAATGKEFKAVRTATHKYAIQIDTPTVEAHGRAFVPEHPDRRLLFDLGSDPREQTDLLAVSQPGDQTAELADALDQILRDLVAKEPGRVEQVELDEQAIDRLRALGYVH